MLTLKRKVVTEEYEDVSIPQEAGLRKYVHPFRDTMTVIIPGTLHTLATADMFLQVYSVEGLGLSSTFSIDEQTYDVAVMFAQVQSGRVVLLG